MPWLGNTSRIRDRYTDWWVVSINTDWLAPRILFHSWCSHDALHCELLGFAMREDKRGHLVEAERQYRLDWRAHLEHLYGPAFVRPCVSEISFSIHIFQVLTRHSLMSGNISSLREPTKALLLILALATIPLFILWMHVQEMRGRPALIPNSLWRNPTFSAICVMVFLSWATLQGMEWFLSLLYVHIPIPAIFLRPSNLACAWNSYQNVQHLSPIEAAVRYMPNIAAGSSLNVVTGLIIHRVPVNYYVVIISGLCTLAPLLMAIIHVDWSFWLASFWVMFLLPTSVDGESLHPLCHRRSLLTLYMQSTSQLQTLSSLISFPKKPKPLPEPSTRQRPNLGSPLASLSWQ